MEYRFKQPLGLITPPHGEILPRFSKGPPIGLLILQRLFFWQVWAGWVVLFRGKGPKNGFGNFTETFVLEPLRVGWIGGGVD